MQSNRVSTSSEMTMDPDEVTRPETVKIDPAGDVMLDVGKPPLKTSMLVSSKVLSVASEVFRVMFGPNFKEGNTLAKISNTEPYKISLPDDEPSAMKTLCYLLHHRNQLPYGEPEMESSQMLQLAIVCDKYNCIGVPRHLSVIWFEENLPSAKGYELYILLATSYLMDEPMSFKVASKQLTLDAVDSFLEFTGYDAALQDVFPSKVLFDLEKERAKLRHCVEDGIQDLVDTFIRKEAIAPTETTSDKTFGCLNHSQWQFTLHDALRVSGTLRELRRLGVWPLRFQEMRITDVLNKLCKYEDKEIATALGFHIFGREGYCTACVFDTRLHIDQLMKKVMAEAKGLCLDCVRGDEEEEPKECRIPH